MPFQTIIEFEAGKLGIWQMDENVSALEAQFCFTAQEKSQYGQLGFDRRKKEYLSIRLLLEAMLGNKPLIEYNQLGKPILVNHRFHISISHNSEMVIVLLSEKNIGVDVENLDRETTKIAGKYLSKDEMAFINDSPNPALGRITYWSAKEAIFKCSPHEGISFNNQIGIYPFDFCTESSFTGFCNSLDYKQLFKLQNRIYKNSIIVICTEFP